MASTEIIQSHGPTTRDYGDDPLVSVTSDGSGAGCMAMLTAIILFMGVGSYLTAASSAEGGVKYMLAWGLAAGMCLLVLGSTAVYVNGNMWHVRKGHQWAQIGHHRYRRRRRLLKQGVTTASVLLAVGLLLPVALVPFREGLGGGVCWGVMAALPAAGLFYTAAVGGDLLADRVLSLPAFECPYCEKHIASNTPWQCPKDASHQHDAEAAKIDSFLRRCGYPSCRYEPDAYMCHHCGRLIPLSRDVIENPRFYAKALHDTRSKPVDDERERVLEKRKRKLEDLQSVVDEGELHNRIIDVRAGAFKSAEALLAAQTALLKRAGLLNKEKREKMHPYEVLRRGMADLQKQYRVNVDEAQRIMGELVEGGALGDPDTLKRLLPDVAEDMRDQAAVDD